MIDAEKLKEEIRQRATFALGTNWKFDEIMESINKQEELPTMQSNDICDYCQNKGKCELPFGCTGYFVGKKVIEVKE